MQAVIKSEPFHIQAYNVIKAEILGCRLRGGEKVSENLLAQKLNISRSPIREAMRMLERDKLLVPAANGMIVNPLPLDEVREIYECRIMLESFAARLTAERIEAEQIDLLEQYINRSAESHRASAPSDIVEANTMFHERIIALCGNNHLIDLNELNRGLTILSRSKEHHGYRRGPEYIDEHQAILAAFRAHDPDAAEKEMRKHITNDLAFYVQKCAGQNGGKPSKI